MSKRQLLAGAAAVLVLATPLIISFEGWRQRAYLDPVGIPTACAGHTQGVRLGQIYSAAECRQLLEADLQIALKAVDRCVPGQPEAARAAFTSFAFNVGATRFCSSTLAKKARAGDLAGACRELDRWTYAGGRELPGLVRRRAAERQLCEQSLAAKG